MTKSITIPQLVPRKVIENEKGNILHGLRSDDPEFSSFGEAYLSKINGDAVKGWKKHLSATLNLFVVNGEVRFVALSESESGGVIKCFDMILHEANHGLLIVPPGVWLAFGSENHESASIVNISTETHDPLESLNVTFSTYGHFW